MKKKPKQWDLFYWIHAEGEIYETKFDWHNESHGFMYMFGNCFPTKELAEPYRDITELIYKCSPEKLKQIKDILKGVTQ